MNSIKIPLELNEDGGEQMTLTIVNNVKIDYRRPLAVRRLNYCLATE